MVFKEVAPYCLTTIHSYTRAWKHFALLGYSHTDKSLTDACVGQMNSDAKVTYISEMLGFCRCFCISITYNLSRKWPSYKRTMSRLWAGSSYSFGQSSLNQFMWGRMSHELRGISNDRIWAHIFLNEVIGVPWLCACKSGSRQTFQFTTSFDIKCPI